MDVVDSYTRIITYMFADGVVNNGRLVVLNIYTENLCEGVTEDIAEKIRTEYWKLLLRIHAEDYGSNSN